MNVFDIIGPVMIGPSSSHTAGAARIGRIASALLGEKPIDAKIHLHGSFAKTYRGHGTDKALIAGILGMKPDDARLRESERIAKESGLTYAFVPDFFEDAHPNTAQIFLKGEEGGQVSVRGASIGGGNILITKVNEMPVELTGQYTALIVLHQDTPGAIASVTELVGRTGANICNFRLAREKKGGVAVMCIEFDGVLDSCIKSQIRALPNILSCTILRPQ